MLVAMLTVFQAKAGVVVSTTRVIFPGQDREVTVKLDNVSKSPLLVQAWLDTGDASARPETIQVPFTVTPALFRLDPNKGQTLRLIYTKEPLAQDRETLFWLNVFEVPPKPDAKVVGENSLQFAFRTRIKMMFRPPHLPGKPEQAPDSVTWTLTKSADGKGVALKASNPTPFVVNLADVAINAEGRDYQTGQGGYIKPFDSADFPIETMQSMPAGEVRVNYASINDWGSSNKHSQLTQRSP